MIRILIALLALAAPVQARPGETITLPGEARTGGDKRPAQPAGTKGRLSRRGQKAGSAGGR